MKNEADDVSLCFPAVWVGQSWEDTHFCWGVCLKLRDENSLNCGIFLEERRDELYYSICEARTGVDSETRDDVMDDHI